MPSVCPLPLGRLRASRSFACLLPCYDLPDDRCHERRSDGCEEGRVHCVLVLCGKVQQREHPWVEEGAGGEREGLARVPQGSS